MSLPPRSLKRSKAKKKQKKKTCHHRWKNTGHIIQLTEYVFWRLSGVPMTPIEFIGFEDETVNGIR